MTEYTFKVTFTAAIEIEAHSEAQARRMLEENLHEAEANFGAWPNGDPILASVVVADYDAPLIEIDGEATC